MDSGTVFLLAATATALATVILFNRMVTLRNRFEDAFDQVDVYLMQQNEVMLRIIDTASAYMQHESVTLTSMIQARNNVARSCEELSVDPGNWSRLDALASAEQVLNTRFASFSGLLESCPELKTNTGIQELQDELTVSQSELTIRRKAFNDAVSGYNRFCRQFPAHLVARAFCFREARPFMDRAPR